MKNILTYVQECVYMCMYIHARVYLYVMHVHVLCVWREMYGRGHALMCAAPPLGQEWRFLKKLGTFFNLGTIFEIDSSTVLSTPQAPAGGAPSVTADPQRRRPPGALRRRIVYRTTAVTFS